MFFSLAALRALYSRRKTRHLQCAASSLRSLRKTSASRVSAARNSLTRRRVALRDFQEAILRGMSLYFYCSDESLSVRCSARSEQAIAASPCLGLSSRGLYGSATWQMKGSQRAQLAFGRPLPSRTFFASHSRHVNTSARSGICATATSKMPWDWVSLAVASGGHFCFLQGSVERNRARCCS